MTLGVQTSREQSVPTFVTRKTAFVHGKCGFCHLATSFKAFDLLKKIGFAVRQPTVELWIAKSS